jgi:hypothetical protein
MRVECKQHNLSTFFTEVQIILSKIFSSGYNSHKDVNVKFLGYVSELRNK